MEQHPIEQPAEGRGLTKTEVRWIFGGSLAIIFGVFIAQNSKPVKVDMVFFSANVRLIWVFLVCGIIGAVIDRLLVRRGLLPATQRRRARAPKTPKTPDA